ncbi:hypothetical protein CHS0354_029354 [Potamilus streckersoni]|uniref:U6 snRNA phosphodiesterase n=1 Tax=Potamilus streckersoni TaxID=2493646 RepID=A0AAE0T6H4_9BIVA|nr:hypothetical protein CHS0354_029354 [Potamilus streckersoni]
MLVSYSESSSDEGEDSQPEVQTSYVPSQKRPLEENKSMQSQKKRSNLPLPDDIIQMFSKKKDDNSDNPELHEGRIRSFPHEEGNWATHVYIPYEADQRFFELQKQLFLLLQPLEFKTMTEYHISLSRTVTIRHHWIEPLIDSLRKEFAQLQSCACELQLLKLYTNDEKTRTFLAVEVSSGCKTYEGYVAAVDKCFKEYRLPPYYNPPLFHISIGWCLGDVTSKITDKVKDSLQTQLDDFFKKETDFRFVDVKEVHCKTGNKTFCLSFADT